MFVGIMIEKKFKTSLYRRFANVIQFLQLPQSLGIFFSSLQNKKCIPPQRNALFVLQNVKLIVKIRYFIAKKLILNQKLLNFEAKKECSPLFLYIDLKSD
jgi:hypothetical protein